MHIYLDDERPAPPGWVLCRWPEEVIALIREGDVETVDLDHDLGEGNECVKPRTGMDVLKFLEEWVESGQTPPRIMIHTMNASVRAVMARVAKSINDSLVRGSYTT